MWDRSYLPPAHFEFVVLADTHYMLEPGNQAVEFASRRRQTARTAYALHAVAALAPPLVIHMGDLVQEFPERPHFQQAVQEATHQLHASGLQPKLVAGNHDVGDKPDPTMPASWVTAQFLADYHNRVGRSWYSWTQGGLHFVVLNSQIMNSVLPAAQEQRLWLEDNLQRHGAQPTVLCLHLPPYLFDPAEPALGHYDNLDEPARSWLLELVQRYQVELLFAAHVHWAFYNELGSTRYYTTPSVAFTRPGFSELFAAAPPAEQGRDDVAKLGFYLVRRQEDGARVHFVRTGGQTDRTTLPAGAAYLLTRTSPDLAASPLGLVLHHPLASVGQTPSVWPSTIRQPVRNDYPLLTALELGVRHLQVPLHDLLDPQQANRLVMAQRAGVHLTATHLWRSDAGVLNDEASEALAQVAPATFLLELPGTPWPSDAALSALAAVRQTTGAALALSTVIPGRQVAGKQHGRAQRGYRWAQLPELDRRLAQQQLQLDRVLCRLEHDEPPWQTIQQASQRAPFSQIKAVDWILELPTAYTLDYMAEACLAMTLAPGSRLYLEPFIDLDRTMDAMPGLLDRCCNPRPVFHLLRHLNTVLFHTPRPWRPLPQPTLSGFRIWGITHAQQQIWLLLPAAGTGTIAPAQLGANEHVTVIELVRGIRYAAPPAQPFAVTEPTLIVTAD
ncbi:MAG: metallophosphoesterase [Caldilineaceae bacterium]